MSMPTAFWFLLGKDIYYRKIELYSMGWHSEVNMNKKVAIAAPYAGPIAIRRDLQKMIKAPQQSLISFYSGSGKLITSIKDNKLITTIGWSNQEDFICINSDGSVSLHNIFTGFTHNITISQEVRDTKVIDAIIFTSWQNLTGIAVMTGNFKVFIINNIHTPKQKALSELATSSQKPTSWVVISEEKGTEVLIAVGKELYRLKQDERHATTMLEADIEHNYASILKMSVSSNAKYLALFTDAGYIWLGGSDLRTKNAEVDTGMETTPKQLEWCGTEAVVAFWEKDYTLMVILKHDYKGLNKMVFHYDSNIYLCPEIDGVRILSNTQHELLQKVPDALQKIFSFHSSDPGNYLLEASKQYQKGSHKADEYICLIKDNLPKAVEQCIEAAGYEFDTYNQKMLIRAAQFGKCFSPDIDPEEYVNMCRLLRVLNAVRDRRIGIPITFTQLQYLTNSVLLDRLVARQQYFLAIQIANYLKMPQSEGGNRILVHWAKYKVSKRQGIEDEVIAKQIGEKLGHNLDISYSEIAQTAAENGRKKLAIKLLDYESKAGEQVRLLVSLDEHEPALVKAIESGDTDLMHDVILKLHNKMNVGDFKLLIHKYPVPLALYKKYCNYSRRKELWGLDNQEDDFSEQALNHISSLDSLKAYERETALFSALEAFKKSRSDSNTEFNTGLLEDALKITKEQKAIDEKLKTQLAGKSIHDTCKELLLRKELKLAEKIKVDYKIPDKRYWWLRIEAMAQLDQWEELEKFSKWKKSPIGYAPFVDVCLEKNKIDEAKKYLPKITDEQTAIKYYIKANELEGAAKIAFEQRDRQNLKLIQAKCDSSSPLREKINHFLTVLNTGRK